jgi:hypothetical protein
MEELGYVEAKLDPRDRVFTRYISPRRRSNVADRLCASQQFGESGQIVLDAATQFSEGT